MIMCDLCDKNPGGYEYDNSILCLRCYKHLLKKERNLNKFINLQKKSNKL